MTVIFTNHRPTRRSEAEPFKTNTRRNDDA
jgi:hypothetical protein